MAGGDGATGGARVMSVRVVGGGSVTAANLIKGLHYAANNGARIINISQNVDALLGKSSISYFYGDIATQQMSTVEEAFDDAYTDRKQLIFVSAGNDNSGTAERAKLTSVLFVANTTATDARFADPTLGSNFGTWVDISAPGTAIVTTTTANSGGSKNTQDYLTATTQNTLNTGTSFAAPNAAGVAALIWSKFHAYTRDQVAAKLLGGADNIDAANPTQIGQLGAGRINAYRALTDSLKAPRFGAIAGLPGNGKTISSLGSIIITAPDRFDPTSVKASSFELKRADGASVTLTVAPYQMGSNEITLTVTGAVTNGTYTFSAKSGFGGLRSPFGVALDGNSDGVGGDAFSQTFQISAVNKNGGKTAISRGGDVVANSGEIVVDGKGNYVIAYNRNAPDYDVYLRRFDKHGNPLTPELQVNTNTAGQQALQDIAMDDAGRFLITWSLTGGSAVSARLYAADATPLTPELTVSDQNAASVARAAFGPDGSFVVTWHALNAQLSGNPDPDYGVYMRPYSAAGTPGAIQLVNTTTTNGQFAPDVATDSQGNFVFVWVSDGQDGDGFAVIRRTFYAAGGASAESLVNVGTLGDQQAPRAAFDKLTGNLAIAWQTGTSTVLARCFDVFSKAIGVGDVTLNTVPGSTVECHNIFNDPTGGFVVSFDIALPPNDYEPAYRRMTAEGVAVGAAQSYADDPRPGDQVDLGFAFDPLGDTVAAWYDGAASAVSIQRFTHTTTVASLRPFNDTNLIDESERMVQPLSTDGLVVTFGSTVNTQADPQVTTELFPYAGSVLNPANWSLTRDGAAVSLGAITATTVNGQTVVTVPITAPITTGKMVLTAKATITDAFGQPLDGDADGQWGGDYVRSWEVLAVGKAGSETRINTTRGDARYPSVVALKSGGYMTFWAGNDTTTSTTSVFAQALDAKGNKSGQELIVNANAVGGADTPIGVLDSDGNIVSVWARLYQDGSSWGLFGQRMSPTGALIGGEFPVTTFTTGNQVQPSLAADDAGHFVVVWTGGGSQDGSGDGIFGQRFAINGTATDKIGGEFLVNNGFTAGDQSFPSVAFDPYGNFAVVWENDYSTPEIRARRIGFSGGFDTGEYVLPVTVGGSHGLPIIGCDAVGNFVVTYGRPDGDGFGSFVRGYENDLKATRFSEISIDSSPAGNQGAYALAVARDGGFTVATVGTPRGASLQDTYARRFLANGQPNGPQFLVNSWTTGYQYPSRNALGMQPDGDFLVAWTSGQQDGDTYGSYAQRYSPSTAPVANSIPPQSLLEDAGASTISLGSYFTDAEEPSTSLTYSLISNNSPTTINVAVANGILTLSSVPDAFGSATVTVRATDSAGLFADRTIGVTVLPVNDVPSFTLMDSPNIVVPINYAAQTVPNFIKTMSPGPAHESGQTPTYEFVGNSHPALFNSLQITPAGTLLFEPAAEVYGSATLQVRVRDSGGTANGGVDVSPPQTFVITVQPDSVFDYVRGQFTLNAHTTGNQQSPSVGSDAAGAAVVAWAGPGADDLDGGIYAVASSVSGTPGTPVRINTTTALSQIDAVVAGSGAGQFVVVWTSAELNDDNVYFQRLNVTVDNKSGAANIVPVGSQIRANLITDEYQYRPSVAMDAAGNFVITWMERSGNGPFTIEARQFKADGTAVAPEFTVAAAPTTLYGGSVGLAADGRFVVTYVQDQGSGWDVYARRYAADSSPTGGPDVVNLTTAGNQTDSSVAVAADGSYAVSWTGPDADLNGVYARRFRADGQPLTGDIAVSKFATGNQSGARVAADAAGNFTVTWSGTGSEDPQGIFVRRFAVDGSQLPMTGVRVNSIITGDQYSPAISMDADGEFTVVWSGETGALNSSLAYTKLDSDGIALQRFGYPLAPSLLRPLEDFIGLEGNPQIGYDLFTYFSSAKGSSESLNYAVLPNSPQLDPSGILASTAINPTTGRLSVDFTSGRSGSATIRVRVRDTSEVPLVTFFKVTLMPRNNAPVLETIAPQVIDEGKLLSVAASGSDPADPVDPLNAGSVLTYSLLAGPSGAVINPTTGAITWSPADGPAAVSFTVRVTDDGKNQNTDGSIVAAPLWSEKSFTVSVNNVAPTATGLIGPPTIEVGKPATFSVAGVVDAPGDTPTLTYDFDWNADGVFDESAASATVAHTFSKAGFTIVGARVRDKDGGASPTYFTNLTVTSSAAAPPKVQAVSVNDGSVQRSRVTSLTVTFNVPVDIADPLNAFELTRQGSGSVTLAGVTLNGNSATLTWTGPFTQAGSLIDGRYTLTVVADKVAANGVDLDGNGDGTAGDNFVMIGSPATNRLFRLFGDADGNGTVSVSDFLAFRLAFLSASPAFDFDNSGSVGASDFLQFRLRFLQVV